MTEDKSILWQISDIIENLLSTLLNLEKSHSQSLDLSTIVSTGTLRIQDECEFIESRDYAEACILF